MDYIILIRAAKARVEARGAKFKEILGQAQKDAVIGVLFKEILGQAQKDAVIPDLIWDLIINQQISAILAL